MKRYHFVPVHFTHNIIPTLNIIIIIDKPVIEFRARNRTEAETREDFTHLIGITEDGETGEQLSKKVL